MKPHWKGLKYATPKLFSRHMPLEWKLLLDWSGLFIKFYIENNRSYVNSLWNYLVQNWIMNFIFTQCNWTESSRRVIHCSKFMAVEVTRPATSFSKCQSLCTVSAQCLTPWPTERPFSLVPLGLAQTGLVWFSTKSWSKPCNEFQ